MNKCNVTGQTGTLYEVHICNSFGNKAEYFVEDKFSFSLSENEFHKFRSKGKDHVGTIEGDYIKLFDKWFSSRDVYDLVQSFEYVPKGYYSNGWLQLTDEEEEWCWQNKALQVYEFVSYERLLEIGRLFEKGTIAEVIDRRFPDQYNPFERNKKNVDVGEQINKLRRMSKEEIITQYIKDIRI